MKKIKILFADDHSVVRSGLRALFQSSPEFDIVGEAGDGEEAIRLWEKHTPDIVLLDITMPKVNGIEATRRIKEKNPDAKVLILTIHEEEQYIFEIIQAGANGYVLKSAEKREIFAAVKAVAGGERFFSSSVSKLIIDGFIRRAEDEIVEPRKTTLALTARETEILRYIALGLSSPEIAKKLFLSVNTVNTHRNNIMQKLGIHDIAGLVRYALQNSLVEMKA
ncbi:MAG TPA: response regulator transcription factor [Bacteroidota bacterium]|jgi:DNA-binding NarL/FixJ family response regulator|nr:response regulator transcription factor [Bacteroidota bacterium]